MANNEMYDVPEVTGNDILREMGYYRDDTVFMSLNLTPEQIDVLNEANPFAAHMTAEEMITEALKAWVASKQAQAIKVA